MAVDEPRNSRARVEHLSWQPRVFYHHNFLSETEIAHMQAGFGNATGTGIKPFTGAGEWFEALQKRVARFTQEPITNFEQGFFSKYDIGQDTEPRRDWYGLATLLKRGAQPSAGLWGEVIRFGRTTRPPHLPFVTFLPLLTSSNAPLFSTTGSRQTKKTFAALVATVSPR